MVANPKPLLIVDDDIGLLRQLRWAFADHKVYCAAARQDAVDLIRKEAIPVAIVDLGLPPDPDGASEGLATLTEILANMHCERLHSVPTTFIKNPSISTCCG
jgi:two-component system NtrC family response regulator